MLFVDETYADPPPPRCGTVKVSSLLAVRIMRTVGCGNDYAPDGTAARIEVAVDLGYSSTSSFAYTFRSNLGVSPGSCIWGGEP